MLGSTTGNTINDVMLAIEQRIKATGFNYSLYEKENIKICNLCATTYPQWKLYAHRDRYGLPVRSMKCDGCGLIFITPRMVEIAYAEFYRNWYRKLVAAFNNKEEEVQIKQRSMGFEAEEAMKFVAKHMPSNLRIEYMLDIGGSTGIFADKICKTLGCSGVVVDPNHSELMEAASKGLTVSCCQFPYYETDKRFNFISMSKTVEHLSNIMKSLKRVKELLTDDGMFLIDIVNHSWLMKLFKNPNMCTKIDHIYQLTDETISQYLAILFPQYEVCKSDITLRYIYYLVKPRC